MRYLVVLCLIISLSRAHLLPNALEDVHQFVQKELQARSHDEKYQMGIEGPPPAGPLFQASESQRFIGVPVPGPFVGNGRNGGFQVQQVNPDAPDLRHAPSQNVMVSTIVSPISNSGDTLPRGLLPPGPMQIEQQQPPQAQQQLQTAASEQLAVIPATLVGPSTFVSEAPSEQIQTHHQIQFVPQEVVIPQLRQETIAGGNRNTGSGDRSKTMEGWVPLDKQGSDIVRGHGIKLQVEEVTERVREREAQPQQQEQEQDQEIEYKEQYTLRKPEVEIVPTNSIKLDEILLNAAAGVGGAKKTRFPVFSRGGRNPKVVIHAQNVIIRGEEKDNKENNDAAPTPTPTPTPTPSSSTNTKQIPAYQAVPQLNNFLRDQLRIAAMNQIFQGHPLNGKPFPRPLTLREIAQAARNGQYPRDFPADPLLQQASSHLQFNVPHVVPLTPDAFAAASIQQQSKFVHPGAGFGLGQLYKNLLRPNGAPNPAAFDPRDPIEYSLLAALSGQKVKIPSVPKIKHPGARDYGEDVLYKAVKDDKPIEPIHIVPAVQPQIPLNAGPTVGDILNPALLGNGNLRQMSEQLLKQMIIQELQDDIRGIPQVPLIAGAPISRPLQRPKVPYGTNAHPFAYLAGGQAPSPTDAIFEESYEYNVPPGASPDDFMIAGEDLLGFPKKPSGINIAGDDDSIPLTKETIYKFGKGLFHQALEFSRYHNPLTLWSKLKSLPPVKLDLYKVPVGVPEGILEKLPESWRSDSDSHGGHAHHHHAQHDHHHAHHHHELDGPDGPPPPPRPPRRSPLRPLRRGGRRGKKKHLPRKNNRGPKSY